MRIHNTRRTHTHLRERVAGVRTPPFRIERGRRRQREDMRIRGLQEMRQASLRAEETAARVDLVHQIEALHRRVECAAQPDCAGVVDEDIDAAEMRDGGVDRRAHVVLFADVALDRETVPAGSIDRCSSGMDRARQFRIGHRGFRRNCDIRAVTRGAQRNRKANAARSAGDEKGFAFECVHPNSQSRICLEIVASEDPILVTIGRDARAREPEFTFQTRG